MVINMERVLFCTLSFIVVVVKSYKNDVCVLCKITKMFAVNILLTQKTPCCDIINQTKTERIRFILMTAMQ